MRALSFRQANTCENATSPRSRCKCRCGGMCHGIARTGQRYLFEALDAEDPHHIPEQKRRKGQEAQHGQEA